MAKTVLLTLTPSEHSNANTNLRNCHFPSDPQTSGVPRYERTAHNTQQLVRFWLGKPSLASIAMLGSLTAQLNNCTTELLQLCRQRIIKFATPALQT